MSCWELLELEPTADQKLIRRAYALKAREVHPEEDPEGFQQLHGAYQQALALAKRGEPVAAVGTPEPSPPAEPQARPEGRYTYRFEKPAHTEVSTVSDGVEQERPVFDLDTLRMLDRKQISQAIRNRKAGALNRFIELDGDPKGRGSRKLWRAFFLSDDFLREQYGRFLLYLPVYLSERRSRELPKAVITELHIVYGFDHPNETERYREHLDALHDLLQREKWYEYACRDLHKQDNAELAAAFTRYRDLLRRYEDGFFDTPRKERDYFLQFGSPSEPDVFLRLLATFVRSHPELPPEYCMFLANRYGLYMPGNEKKPERQALMAAITAIAGDAIQARVESMARIKEHTRKVNFAMADLVKRYIAGQKIGRADFRRLFQSEAFLAVRYSEPLLTHLETYFQIHTRLPLELVAEALESYEGENRREARPLIRILRRYETDIYQDDAYIDDSGY